MRSFLGHIHNSEIVKDSSGSTEHFLPGPCTLGLLSASACRPAMQATFLLTPAEQTLQQSESITIPQEVPLVRIVVVTTTMVVVETDRLLVTSQT